MKQFDFSIRAATPDDAGALLAIYTPYVTNTAISFECEAPGLSEFQKRIENTLKRYPYLLAERDGEILGYAYTGPFVGRAAYAWAAETTIYLKEGKKKMGIGRALYEALEKKGADVTMVTVEGAPHEDAFWSQEMLEFIYHFIEKNSK